MKVLILAAGYGTRLASVVKDAPKPLIPINNKPLIDYIVSNVKDIKSLTEIAVVTNNKFFGQFNQWAKTHKDIKVKIVNDKTNSPEERLGSVGDIYFVWEQERKTDDWLVVGGDNLFDHNLSEFIDFAIKKSPAVSIGIFDIHDKKAATKFGVVAMDDHHKVTSFEEKPAEAKASTITMCLYYFPKITLPYLSEYLSQSQATDTAGSYIQWLSQKKNVYGFQFKGKWYDIGSIESLNEAQKYFK